MDVRGFGGGDGGLCAFGRVFLEKFERLEYYIGDLFSCRCRDLGERFGEEFERSIVTFAFW